MAVSSLLVRVGIDQRPVINLFVKQAGVESAYAIPAGSVVKCVVLKKASRAKQSGNVQVIYPSGTTPITINSGDLGNDWATGKVAPSITSAYTSLLLAAATEALEIEILVIPPAPNAPLYFYEEVTIARTALQG